MCVGGGGGRGGGVGNQMERKFLVTNFPKFGCTSSGTSGTEISENAAPFASGNFWRKPSIFVNHRCCFIKFHLWFHCYSLPGSTER